MTCALLFKSVSLIESLIAFIKYLCLCQLFLRVWFYYNLQELCSNFQEDINHLFSQLSICFPKVSNWTIYNGSFKSVIQKIVFQRALISNFNFHTTLANNWFSPSARKMDYTAIFSKSIILAYPLQPFVNKYSPPSLCAKQ